MIFFCITKLHAMKIYIFCLVSFKGSYKHVQMKNHSIQIRTNINNMIKLFMNFNAENRFHCNIEFQILTKHAIVKNKTQIFIS